MKIVFVLVEPAVPENVGAAARAMNTMGFDSMRLVNPCDHLSGPARWLAHASNDILENAATYPSLKEALTDIDFVVGTSAKTRHVKADYYRIDEMNQVLTNKDSSIRSVAIVFGREESGMTNEELTLCDVVTSVPMKKLYPSLNLAQSVMLYAYELSRYKVVVPEKVQAHDENTFRVMKSKSGEALSALGFVEGSNIYNRLVERLSILGKDDMHLVLSVCNKLLDGTSNNG